MADSNITKRALAAALKELMEQKPFSKINVAEICEKCGRVFAFQDDLLEELEERIAVTTGFFVVNHEVKLYGYCKACREILEREKKN